MATWTATDLVETVRHAMPAAIDGRAEAEPLAAELRRAIVEVRTGWLVQDSPGGWLRLGFRDGALVEGNASAPLGSLGRALVRYGLSQPGPTAAPNGGLTGARLAAGRALYLGDLLLAGFERGGTVSFEAGPAPAPLEGPRLSTTSLMLDACRRTRKEGVALRALGDTDRVPRVAAGADLSRVRLMPQEREAIAALGTASLEEVAAADPEGVSVRAILALYCLGHVDLDGPVSRSFVAAGRGRGASADALVALGRLYRDHGWRLRAAAVLRQALRLAPQHPVAHAELQALPCADAVGGRW